MDTPPSSSPIAPPLKAVFRLSPGCYWIPMALVTRILFSLQIVRTVAAVYDRRRCLVSRSSAVSRKPAHTCHLPEITIEREYVWNPEASGNHK